MKIFSLYRRFTGTIIVSTIFTAAFSMAFSAASVAATTAEDEDSPRWYQIEMVVFSQRNPGGTDEDWPHDIALAYPHNWVELKSPGEARVAPGASGGLSGDSGSRASDAGAAYDSDYAGGQYTAEQALEPVDLATAPFYRLPDAERQLNREASALRRDSRYRVLFHQAWRQPLVEYEDSPAVLVDGGETYGDNRELEGTVTISVSRYLHLHTNLWLSRFKANYGQEFGDWPELPKKPSLARETVNPLLYANNSQTDSRYGAGGLSDGPTGLLGDMNSDKSEYGSILSRPYIVDQVVTLQQSRKMRSDELHYLDHPLMGLLIKITPYELPEIERESEKPPKIKPYLAQ